MKFGINHIIVLAVISVSALSSAKAEDSAKIGAENINLKMGSKNLTFTHRKHQKKTNNECWHCHKTETGKIDGWGKEAAHNLCIPCHDLEDKGPVECKHCHDA